VKLFKAYEGNENVKGLFDDKSLKSHDLFKSIDDFMTQE